MVPEVQCHHNMCWWLHGFCPFISTEYANIIAVPHSCGWVWTVSLVMCRYLIRSSYSLHLALTGQVHDRY